MEYTIGNGVLEAAVQSKGAQLCRVTHLATGEQLLFDGDAGIWPWHAPILFPHCGAVLNDTIVAKGQKGSSGRHGFARHREFTLVENTATSLRLRQTADEETRAVYPYEYQFDVVFTLEGNTLTNTLEVSNPAGSGDVLPFNVGYHPAFAVTDGGARWALHFEVPEDPDFVETTPGGLVSGNILPYGKVQDIAITDDLFAEDSIAFTGLKSKTLSLVQQGTGRAVRVGIEGFPYVLVWGQAKGPHRYVCIEPWTGIPDPVTPYGEFADKPGVIKLGEGETFAISMPVTFTL